MPLHFRLARRVDLLTKVFLTDGGGLTLMLDKIDAGLLGELMNDLRESIVICADGSSGTDVKRKFEDY